MSAAGATGPAPTEGNVTAAVTAKLADRQLTQTELEMQASRRLAERRAAGLGVSLKKTNGAAPITPSSLGETVDTGIAAAVTAKQAQAEGIKHETAPANVQSAPKVMPEGAVPLTATVTLTANKPEDEWNKSELRSASTGDMETGTAAAVTAKPNAEGIKSESGERPGPNASQAGGEGADNSEKPIPIQPKFANFPAELKLLPNWVLWRYLPPKSKKGGKWRKVPFQPNGKAASSTDRATWSEFDACCAAYARGGFDGLGFVFDGEIGTDGLCYGGVDLDACVRDGEVQSLARERIKRLNTYTERSVSGTGIHCIARAEPLDHIVKFDGVEIYTTGRYFTFTGAAFGEIKAAAAEVAALVNEVRAKEAASKQQQSGRSGFNGAPHSIELPDNFKDAQPAQAFAALPQDDNLADGIRTTQWFATLSPEQKDQVIDYALEIIAKNTRLLEMEANGGNNTEWYKLTTAIARSGAPHAEDIFVKHASGAKNADSDEALRQHFSRCRASQPSGNQGITVGTLLLVAQQNGANFDRWKCPVQCMPALAPVTWSATELKISFANIPHRRWIYGTYLIRGEITVLAAPGGAGKTALATGIAVEIATGTDLLGEKIYQAGDLKVLFINGEDGGSEIQRRVWAFCLAHAHKLGGQNLDRLYVAGANDARVQRLSFLQTIDRNFSTLDRSGFEVLESALETLHPDLLVLDPLVAFSGGGNMNDNAVMAQVIRELKRLATKFDCAVLIVHHTRKGAEDGNPEAISGASATVNLARRALMPVPMTKEEAEHFRVLPSDRFRYFKLVDAKSNLAPRSADSPWYRLHSVELPNPEPPVYPHGDNVQAVQRVNLSTQLGAPPTTDEQKIQDAILNLINRGKMIDGRSYPYSPSAAGASKERALLDDAMAAVRDTTVPREWPPEDLIAATKGAIKKMKNEGLLVEKELKELMSEPGRFRRGRGLAVGTARAEPQPVAKGDTAGAAVDGGQLLNSRSID